MINSIVVGDVCVLRSLSGKYDMVSKVEAMLIFSYLSVLSVCSLL